MEKSRKKARFCYLKIENVLGSSISTYNYNDVYVTDCGTFSKRCKSALNVSKKSSVKYAIKSTVINMELTFSP